jgi:hypothetical protein
MMNHRHLTRDEQQILRRMADDAGVVEMLRCLAIIVGHDHPDLYRSNQYKTDLLLVAGRLSKDTGETADAEDMLN